MTQAFNLALLANKVNSSGQLNADTGLYNSPIPSGSVFLLYQSAAPTGWTQVTSLNDYALRIVSGVGGTTAGTTAFSSVFANQTPSVSGSVDATTLSSAQIPSHAHSYTAPSGATPGLQIGSCGGPSPVAGTISGTTGSIGGGGSHTHTFGSLAVSAITLNVKYANIILCSKN